MNNHPRSIRLAYTNWTDQDWYNWQTNFGSKWLDSYINEQAWAMINEDSHVNSHGDLINMASAGIHSTGHRSQFRKRKKYGVAVNSKQDFLDLINEVLHGG